MTSRDERLQIADLRLRAAAQKFTVCERSEADRASRRSQQDAATSRGAACFVEAAIVAESNDAGGAECADGDGEPVIVGIAE